MTVPILMYHDISPAVTSRLLMTSGRTSRQFGQNTCNFSKDQGYTSVLPADLARQRRADHPAIKAGVNHF